MINKMVSIDGIRAVWSQSHKERMMELFPFIRHQIHSKGYNTEAEKNIYNFILNNWLNCVPQYERADSSVTGYSLKGYLIISKETIQSTIYNFIKI